MNTFFSGLCKDGTIENHIDQNGFILCCNHGFTMMNDEPIYPYDLCTECRKKVIESRVQE